MSFGVVVLFVSYSELLNSLQNKTNKKIIMLYKLHSKSHMSHFMFWLPILTSSLKIYVNVTSFYL